MLFRNFSVLVLPLAPAGAILEMVMSPLPDGKPEDWPLIPLSAERAEVGGVEGRRVRIRRRRLARPGSWPA